MQSLKKTFVSVDLSSRGIRRNVLTLVICLLERIRDAEERYTLCLRCTDDYNFTEYSIARLYEAIDVLNSVYDKIQCTDRGLTCYES
jgi:hypothetical protein